MHAIIHAADIQDRDGGVLLMGSLFGLFPFLLKLYADSGYQGPKFQAGLHRACRDINLEIVKRSELHKFVVLPKRWIVERTIGWLNRCRRLAKDWECLNQNGLAFLRWASIRMMIRKLCQNTKSSRIDSKAPMQYREKSSACTKPCPGAKRMSLVSKAYGRMTCDRPDTSISRGRSSS